jgi:hypothetical protein
MIYLHIGEAQQTVESLQYGDISVKNISGRDERNTGTRHPKISSV